MNLNGVKTHMKCKLYTKVNKHLTVTLTTQSMYLNWLQDSGGLTVASHNVWQHAGFQNNDHIPARKDIRSFTISAKMSKI